MTRTVNFSTFSNNEGLPNINTGQNWVNDRQRRFHSEPRRVAGKPTVQGNGNTFALPTPQNGHLVNGNHGNGSYSNFDPPRDGRRLQSLPPSKPKMDEVDSRQVRSAPNNEGKNGHDAGRHGDNMAESRPRPQPRSRINDNDAGRELSQRTHGKATRSYEERYLRSNKFASSWAQVRADNPAFNDLSPDGSPLTARKFRSKDHHSPDSSNKVNSTRDSSPSTHEDSKKEHKKAVTKQHRGRSHHKTRTKTRLKFAVENNDGQSPGRTYNSGEESDALWDDQGSPNSEQRERKVSRKKEWVDSVVVPPYEKPPPKYVGLRYLDNLTFKPTINTGKDVFQTYVVKEKKPLREKTCDPNRSFSENEEGYDSPMNDSTFSQDDSDDNSQERSKREPFLNRREAIKYIKMNNVYGSDAYKNQRKEWFIQKFAEVQETKAKYEADQKREEKKKRQEDMKRQKQQLNYVRKKFRKEQEHRFRTQYVTARVLEYEQVNRHVYGLPEDYLDLANEVNRANTDDEDMNPKQDTESQENKSQPQGKNAKQTQKPVNKSSPTRKCGNKSNTSPTKGDLKKKKEEEEARVALAKACENQKSWYAQTDSRHVSPAGDSRSHVSHATSGYESEKQSTDQNVNEMKGKDGIKQESIAGNENSKDHPTVHVPPHDKNKDNQAAKNRLESQKNIYARDNVNKTKPHAQQQIQKQKMNVNKSLQPKHNQDTKGQLKQPGGKFDGKLESNIQSGDLDSDSKRKEESHKETTNTQREKEGDQKKSNKIMTTLGSNKDGAFKPSALHSNHPNIQKQIQQGPNSTSSEITSSNKDTRNKTSTSQNENEDKVRAANTKVGEVSNSSKSNKAYAIGLSSSDNNQQKPESRHNTNTASGIKGANSISRVGQVQKKEDQGKGKSETKIGEKESEFDHAKANQRIANQDKAYDKIPTTNGVQNTERQRPSSKHPKPATTTQPSTHSGSHLTQPASTSPIQQSGNSSHSNRGVPKIVTYEDLEDLPHQSAHSAIPNTIPGPRKESITSYRTAKPHQAPSKNNNPSANTKNAAAIGTSEEERRKSRAESGKSGHDPKNPPKKKGTVADRMFNIKTGPTWDPQKKTPKMEGIDTVVVTSKDKKGRDVKTRKDVKDVVKEADNLLKVNTGANDRRGSSRQRRSRTVSPDLTLGSDFDVDDDDELEQDDIFERLRKKYNIAIDSDEEDNV